ncbi:phosphatidylinositol N-acetylglucosaminyltransferase [Malassezia furfur]|uniref:phosphatidylinositol N-acetylglucosaminyltransferase n=1 Tax=Malassezia furfur TaxID=55194 RepID=A0ABY8EYT2_MALFU|nr:phosphatidylinositol N-acetylglucosaminyltransferase [Malassezia furfur]
MSHSPHPVRTIHALNVVRVLVMDSTLAPAMRAHLGSALARAVACFASAHWGVRNASMMLFSAVCTRYYGIHALSPSAGGGGGRRTLDALLATCPALGEALVATLARGAEHGQGGTEHGSALYASLLLLSTLGADQVAATSPAALLLASLRTHVEPWAYGANAQLRAAAATCYAALLPPAERAEVAERVARGASLRDQNRLHGQLLLLRALGVPAAVPADVLDGNACAVTVAAYLDVVRDDLARATLATDVRAHTAAWLARLLDAACTSTEDGGPMGRLLRDPFRTWVLAPAWSLALALRVRLPSVQVALRAHDDVRAPLLAHLGTAHAAVADAGWDPAQVFAAACNVARAREPAHDVRIAAAHLAYALRAHAQWTDAERTALLVAAWTAESAGVREALIPLLGAAAHGDGEHRVELARACVPLWEACTADDASLAARLGTAHALKAAGVGDVEADAPAEGRRLGAAHGAAPAPLALRTHRILLHLVHDDHADVRDAACALVSPSVARPTSFGALAAFAPALRALRMGDVACTEHLWRTLSDAAPTAFASDAASLLAAPTHAAQQHAAHTLFPTEAANQYYDRVADMLRAHRFFASRRLPVPAALREAGAAPLAGADAPFAVRLQRALCADLGAVLRGEKRPEVVDAAFGALLVTPWRPKAQAKGGAGTPGLDGGSDGGPRGGPDGGSAGGPGARTPPGNTPASEYAAPPASDTAAYSAPPASDPSARSAPAPSDPASPPSGPHPLCIALLSDFFFPNVGGVEGHMYMVAQHLVRRGHKVIVVTHAYAPHRAGVRHVPGGIKVFYVPLQVLVRQDTLPNFFALLPVLRAILVRERVDIVHGHQALSSIAHEGLFHAKALGLRTVFTDHSLFGFADVGSVLTNKLLRFALTDADHVVCVSHTARENTVLRAALPPHDVSTIPNAIDAQAFRPTHTAPTDHVCIVVLSRLMYRKGIDLLLTAIPALCARHADVRFVIGGDGPKAVALEQMRERHMLQDRVELVGAVRQRDVCAHLNRGHIFLNTSLTEAFGTSIIEATCAGLYVVTTRVGGIPELLPPSMMRLAEPSADAIVRETDAAIAHIRAGRHDPDAQHHAVAEMYAWAHTVARLERVYARVMARAPTTSAARFRRHWARDGPVAGKIVCVIIAVQMVMVVVLEWLVPRAKLWRPGSVMSEKAGT